MKNFLSKRKILIFFLAIIILALLAFLSPSIAERAKLRIIANMNNKVIPITYDFVYDERPEHIGDAKVEYVFPTKREQAEIYLPDTGKECTVNITATNNICSAIMDYPEYAVKVKFIRYKPYTATVNFYLSGEIRVLCDVDIDLYIYFESKNDPIQPKLVFSMYAQNTNIFPYENGFIIDDYNKLKEVSTLRYDVRGRLVSRSFYAQIQDVPIKSDMVWIAPTDDENYIAIMVDTFKIGIFDTNVAYLWDRHLY